MRRIAPTYRPFRTCPGDSPLAVSEGATDVPGMPRRQSPGRVRRGQGRAGHAPGTVPWPWPKGPGSALRFADQGQAVADAQDHLHRSRIGCHVLVEADERAFARDDAAARERVVGDDQAALRQAGHDRVVVADITVLVCVDEDEIERALEAVDRLDRRSEVKRDLR